MVVGPCGCRRGVGVMKPISKPWYLSKGFVGPLVTAMLFALRSLGIADIDPDLNNAASSPDPIWDRAWHVNVMSHVYAARVMLPGFKERGEGLFVNVVSAAGLLTQVGSAVYSTTKHAALPPLSQPHRRRPHEALRL